MSKSWVSASCAAAGRTAKALAQYGQGLAGNYFNDYLNQLGGVANRGVSAAGQIGQAGTEGGRTAADAMQTGITRAFGSAAGMATNIFGTPAPDPFAAMSTDSAMADMGIYQRPRSASAPPGRTSGGPAIPHTSESEKPL